MDELKVKPIKIKNDKSLKKINDKINDRLPKLHLSWLLIGARGSGKTTLLINIINRFYKNIFKNEHIFLISPSLGLDKQLDLIDTPYKFDNFDIDIIEEIINQCKDIINTEGKDKCPQILLILDDCITEGAFNSSGVIEHLFYRSRHYNVNIILTCQKYSSLSRGIRVNAIHQSFFEPFNESEKQWIIDTHSNKFNKDKFNNMLNFVYNTEHNFFHIDYGKKKGMRYQVNFDEYLNINDF